MNTEYCVLSLKDLQPVKLNWKNQANDCAGKVLILFAINQTNEKNIKCVAISTTSHTDIINFTLSRSVDL